MCGVISAVAALLAIEPVARPASAVDRLWIVDGGMLIPVRDRRPRASSYNPSQHRGADTKLLVARARRGPRHSGRTSLARAPAWTASARSCVLADGVYLNARLLIPQLRHPDRA